MSSAARILFTITSSTLFLYAIFELCFITDASNFKYWTTIHAVICSLWFLSLLRFSKNYYGSIISFSTGFVFCLSTFHLSFIFLDTFSIYDFGNFFASKMGTKYRIASATVILSLSSYGLGLLTKTKQKHSLPSETPTDDDVEAKKTFYAAGVILLIFSAIGFVMTLFTVGNIFAYSRLDLFKGIGDTRGFGLFLMTFPSALMFLFIGARTPFIKIFTYPFVVCGALFLLFLGYRSNLFFPATVGACLWLKSGRTIPKTILAGLIIAALVVIPTVKYLRTAEHYSDIQFSDVERSFNKAESAQTFLELGAILGLLSNVMDWIPKEYPYKYGMTYVQSLGSAIPNIGFTFAKNKREMIKGLNKQEIYQTLKPSDWYTYTYSKWMFNHGGGSGFSMAAEAYMNFGYFGFFFIFFTLGIVFSQFDTKDIYKNPMTIVYLALLIWPIYYGVRNETGAIIKIISFNMLIIFSAKVVGIFNMTKRLIN